MGLVQIYQLLYNAEWISMPQIANTAPATWDILSQDSNIYREDSPKQWTNIQLVELYPTHQLVFSNDSSTLTKNSQNHEKNP